MKYCSVCKAKFEDNVSFCPTDGEVLEEDPSSLVGTVLDGQYQIESMLGKGGMGAVYGARHILLGDRVAIKVLPAEMRTNAEWLRRFRREGQAARRFRHPNAVTVYDLRTSADGTIYLVMEYVEGHTLDAELRQRGRFAPAAAFAVLEPIMSVLNAAHAMGVVHRDLKPENIMIGNASAGGESTIKLLDLGIAKMREIAGADSGGTTALTMAGQVLGTPYYMSPEQWGEVPRDGNVEIDGRADLYSLGLVLYEMVSGKRPFASATLFELRRDHISVTPPFLHESLPDVPEEFSRAVAHAIAKDRADRPATTAALSAELKAAIANAPSSGEARTAITNLGSIGAPTGTQEPLDTKSSRTAPTMITMDSPASATPDVPVRPGSQSSSATFPTVISAAEKTSPEVETRVPATVPPSKRSSLPLVLGVVVIGLLLVGGVGAFLYLSSQRKAANGPNLKAPATSGATSADLSAGAHEIARYWLEVESEKGVATMTAGTVMELDSGQSFKFHFSPSENGHLYIIGPGNQNVPSVFLTDRPDSASGLKTNEVKSGLDFSFPKGDKKWITLDKIAGSENYTIVFSGQPLTVPAFFASQSVRALSPDEQAELAAFRDKYKSNTVAADTIAADVMSASGAQPFVSVKVPQTMQEGAPVIFDIRIQHK